MTLPDNAPARNASTEEWQAYASDLGIEGTEDMTRTEAIEAVERVTATPTEAAAQDWDDAGPKLETKGRDRGAYFDI